MRIVFALQLIVPLALIAWLALAPPSNRASLWTQIAATALALLAIALAGIWLFPPGWVIWLYGALFVLAAVKALRRRHAVALWPVSGRRWSATLVFVLLGGYAAMQVTSMLAGRQAPLLAQVDLAFPLHGGTFMVVNGGNDIRINAHLKTRDSAEPRFARWHSNGYGVDDVAIVLAGLVGGNNETAIDLNRKAAARQACEWQLKIMHGATQLFEEPGAIEQVALLSCQ